MNITFLYIPIFFGLSIEVYFILIIIAVPTFFFWRWLLKKYIKTDRIRRVTIWAATLIATPVIYLGIILLLIFGIAYTPKKDFDKSLWSTDKEVRFQMADNIINGKLLIGKDTNQVKQILGEPTKSNSTMWRTDALNSWTYDMGAGGGGLGFMFHNLIIKFDKGYVIVAEHIKIRD